MIYEAINIGDVLEITENGPSGNTWKGFRAKVVANTKNDPIGYIRLKPLSERPDGYGRAEFLRTKETLIKVG